MNGIGENEASSRMQAVGKCDSIPHMQMKNTLLETESCDRCSQATGVVRMVENHEEGRSTYRESIQKLIDS